MNADRKLFFELEKAIAEGRGKVFLLQRARWAMFQRQAALSRTASAQTRIKYTPSLSKSQDCNSLQNLQF